MEWLKDQKNLPIVVALAVFVMLAAGGLIAFELGAFSGSSTPLPVATLPQTGSPVGQPYAPPISRGVPPSLPIGGPRGARTPALVGAVPAAKTPISMNPLVGPDPFKIPGGLKQLAKTNSTLIGPKPALRDEVSPLNLFQIRPPAPPVPPVIANADTQTGANPAANYRLSGVVTGSDGINAILEVGGQSQSVKPGDSLPDGTQVQNIQATSVTLRTPGGTVFNLPISAGTPDQGADGPGQGGFYNGRSPYGQGYPQPGQGYTPPGQGFTPTGQG